MKTRYGRFVRISYELELDMHLTPWCRMRSPVSYYSFIDRRRFRRELRKFKRRWRKLYPNKRFKAFSRSTEKHLGRL